MTVPVKERGALALTVANVITGATTLGVDGVQSIRLLVDAVVDHGWAPVPEPLTPAQLADVARRARAAPDEEAAAAAVRKALAGFGRR